LAPIGSEIIVAHLERLLACDFSKPSFRKHVASATKDVVMCLAMLRIIASNCDAALANCRLVLNCKADYLVARSCDAHAKPLTRFVVEFKLKLLLCIMESCTSVGCHMERREWDSERTRCKIGDRALR
jgi:hypothetical protein